jgi:Cd(II)/Pb(II)-responsive transcriptional regulator
MKIGALSQATGVEVDTIRFYEKAGLLPAPQRLANGYRHYGQPHLERLAFIRHCRALDMGLAETRLLLHSLDSRDAQVLTAVDAVVDTQLSRVRARLRSLQALERQLQALKGRCDSHHEHGSCGILAELVAAAQGEACACHQPTQGA